MWQVGRDIVSQDLHLVKDGHGHPEGVFPRVPRRETVEILLELLDTLIGVADDALEVLETLVFLVHFASWYNSQFIKEKNPFWLDLV